MLPKIITLLSFVQLENAALPIEVTLLGTVTFVRFMHLENAE